MTMTIRRSAVKAGRSLCSAFYFRASKGWNSPYINHFISADTVVASYANPQDLNRFSYVNDNPLRYTDPTGHAYCDLINSQNKEDCNAGEWRIATSDVLHAHHKNPGVLAVPGGLIVMYGGVKFTEKYLNDVFVVTP